MKSRRRLLVAALLAAAAGGLIAALVLPRSGGAAATPGVVTRGAFRSIGWGTHGEATVVRERSGAVVVRFGPRFHTQKAPLLYVYVGRYHGGRETSGWTLVHSLNRVNGAQEYPLASVPPARSSVMVFCAKCDRTWGAALLQPGG